MLKMRCKIIIFKEYRFYTDNLYDSIEYDEDEVRALCDYEERWEAIDHLLKDDAYYQMCDAFIDEDGCIRSENFNVWWGYCLKESSIQYL